MFDCGHVYIVSIDIPFFLQAQQWWQECWQKYEIYILTQMIKAKIFQ